MKTITIIGLIILFWSCASKPSYPSPLEAGWNGEKVCKVLQETDELRLLECTFPPGVGHEKHTHSPHFGYTIKGSKFKIVTDSTTKEVNVPNGYSFKKDEFTTHEVLNIGKDTAVFLIYEQK